MRLRWTAAIVVWYSLLLPFAAPYLAGDPNANLPACCRADGKHHCAMSARVLGDDGQPGVRKASEPCPYRTLHLAPANPTLASPSAGSQFQFLLNEDRRVAAVTASRALNPQLGIYPKRGPPLLG